MMSALRIQPGPAARASRQVKLFRVFVRAIFLFLFRVQLIGLENIPRTPVIVCMNHLGWAEGFMVLLFFPIEPRIYGLGERDVATRSNFRLRILNWLQLFIPLDRDQPRAALRAMKDVLARGGSLILAPEGKLGHQEGALGELQNGAAHLSLVSGVPLLPVGATGTLELWWRKTLTLRVGQVIDPIDFAGEHHSSTRALTARLDREMRALLPGDNQQPRLKPLRNWLTKLF